MSANPTRAPTRAQTAARYDSSIPPNSRRSITPSQRYGGLYKADYRPMVTVACRTANRTSRISTAEPPVPSRHSMPHQDHLDTIDEDESDTDSIITALTSDIPKPRYVYSPPTDAFAATEMGIVTAYLDDTDIGDHMLSLCQDLLSDANLPYNPYPSFLNRLHHLAEKFHMHRQNDDAIRAILQNPLQKTSSPVIWGVKGQTNVWGLRDIVHTVDPKFTRDYAWLLSSIPPPGLAEVEGSDVKGSILLALTGPAVFSGTFYPSPPSVDFILEFMMYGTNLGMALKVFAKTLRDDVKRTVSSKNPHHFIGISLMAANGRSVLWDRKKIETEREDFFSAVEKAVRFKQPPIMTGIFAVDDELKIFKQGTKKYVFHFVETDQDTGTESFTSFSEHTYGTLFTSIFLRKADAEAYIVAFKRQLDPAGRDTVRPAARDDGPSRSGTRKQPTTRRGRRMDQSPKPNNQTSMGEDIKEPVRQAWEQELAGLRSLKGDSSRIIYLLLLMILMDRSKYTWEELIDVYRFLHSTSSDFSSARAIGAALRAFIRQNENSQQEFACRAFLQYKRHLLAVLDPSLHERSSDYHAAHRLLQVKLDKITKVQRNENGSLVTYLPMGPQTEYQLMQIETYCDSIQLALTEDAVAFLTHLNLKELMATVRQKFPHKVLRPQTRVKAVPEQASKKKSSKNLTHKPPIVLNHGVEANSIIHQRNLYINVQWSVQTSMHPVVTATEGVLMQYLIDVKLDQVWKSYLMELMDADHLPPNPYPRLISRLRQAAIKMELWREADDKLCARLRHGKAKSADRTNHVFVLEECGGYGLSPALATVMAVSFKKLIVLAELMTNKDVISHKGQFQLSSGLAISGYSPLYGRMMPYLPYLELHEHYYIRGPMGADRSATELFATVVYNHLADVCSMDKFVIMGLFVDGQLVLDQDKLEEDQQRAEGVIISATSEKSLIHLKVYYAVGWRYVAIHKYYMLHYIYVDRAEDKHRAYFSDDPIYLYQNVFLSLEEAVNHYQQSGAYVRGNPLSASNVAVVNRSIDESIPEYLADHNLLCIHKLLMCKALVNKNSTYLGETWRMLHGVAFQLEYLGALAQSLCDIIQYALQHPNAVETAEYLEGVAAARTKAKKGTTVPKKTFPLEASKLGLMVTAYCEKVQDVANEPCSLAPLSLPRVIGDKLKGVVERNPQTGELSLIIEKQTIVRLKEIQDLLLPVKAALEHDVHSACTKVHDAIHHLVNRE